MLQVANDLGPVNYLWQVMVDVETTRVIHPSATIANDLNSLGQRFFDFRPGHRHRLDFDLRPSQARIAALVLQAGIMLNR